MLKSRLTILVPDGHVEHIGSTAVPGLPAKDVVDLLLGVSADSLAQVAHRLTEAAFDLEGDLDHHYWLSWPSRHARESVIHVVEYGSRPWSRRLAFRDLLRRDAHARRVYLEAKRSAAADTADWTSYTQAKARTVADLLRQD